MAVYWAGSCSSGFAVTGDYSVLDLPLNQEITQMDGLTEKQSQKLRELYQKLKERNSPTPPKRSRRSKPVADSEPYSRGPRVSNLKEYKLVTVDDMSEAYK